MVVYEINSQPIARIPSYFGVNIETFTHQDSGNLWDWIHHSGSTALRILHPEVHLRHPEAPMERIEIFKEESDFSGLRRSCVTEPDSTLDWTHYRFTDSIPWLGVPDEIVDRCVKEQILPILSIGYLPHHYPTPLLENEAYEHSRPWTFIHWPAAASAYEYHFAFFYRYLQKGVRWFSLHNEPDMYTKSFHLPPDLDAKRDEYFHTSSFQKGGPLFDRFFEVIGQQIGTVARIARLALEDAKTALHFPEEEAEDIRLLGGVSPFADILAPYILPHVDILDQHTYGEDPDEFTRKADRVLHAASRVEKRASFTEFGLKGGSTLPEEFLFSMSRSLQLAAVFMRVLQSGQSHPNPLELLTFYLLAGPSTHRNYKHLLYGDLNLLDWSGMDHPLWEKDPMWHPSAEELELRHATPAFDVFRMFARLVDPTSPSAVLTADFVLPRHEKALGLSAFTVRKQDRVTITFLNPLAEERVVIIDTSDFDQELCYGFTRVCSRSLRDWCTDHRRIMQQQYSVTLPAESVTQVCLTSTDYSALESITLHECGCTAGHSDRLALHQTTRLKVVGSLNEKDVDLTNDLVNFTSAHPDRVCVRQGGLVQRIRGDQMPVTITAEVSRTLQDHCTIG